MIRFVVVLGIGFMLTACAHRALQVDCDAVLQPINIDLPKPDPSGFASPSVAMPSLVVNKP